MAILGLPGSASTWVTNWPPLAWLRVSQGRHLRTSFPSSKTVLRPVAGSKAQAAGQRAARSRPKDETARAFLAGIATAADSHAPNYRGDTQEITPNGPYLDVPSPNSDKQSGALGVPALCDRSLATNASAAQSERWVHMETHDEVGRRLASPAAYPSSLA